MQHILAEVGIPSDTLVNAFNYLTDHPEAAFALNATLKIKPPKLDSLTVAKYAVRAILAGPHMDEARVRGYVAKCLTGDMPKPAAPIIIPAVVIPDSTPVVNADGTVTGRKGRTRSGTSDFSKAVAAIEALPASDRGRASCLKAIMAQDISKASASVYLWRYNNGER